MVTKCQGDMKFNRTAERQGIPFCSRSNFQRIRWWRIGAIYSLWVIIVNIYSKITVKFYDTHIIWLLTRWWCVRPLCRPCSLAPVLFHQSFKRLLLPFVFVQSLLICLKAQVVLLQASALSAHWKVKPSGLHRELIPSVRPLASPCSQAPVLFH